MYSYCIGLFGNTILTITMNELNKLNELMVITMEECGELIQACSKAIRCNDYNNDTLK